MGTIKTTTPFEFSVVCQELYGSSSTVGRTLIDAHTHTISVGGTFNGTYNTEGTSKTLLDFRGYTSPVTGDTTAPSTPSNLTWTYSGGDLDGDGIDDSYLNWGASTDNIGVTGYQIEELKDGVLNRTLNTLSLSYIIYPDLLKQTYGTGNYCYRVRAHDAIPNYSAWSNQVCFTIAADIFTITISKVGDSLANVCSKITYINIYHNDTGSTTYPREGYTFYTDAAGTIPFNGGSLYYKVSIGHIFRISSTGLIITRTDNYCSPS